MSMCTVLLCFESITCCKEQIQNIKAQNKDIKNVTPPQRQGKQFLLVPYEQPERYPTAISFPNMTIMPIKKHINEYYQND